MTPHTCPKCNGQGHVWTPPWVPGDQPTYDAVDCATYECPVCKGAGVLWEAESL